MPTFRAAAGHKRLSIYEIGDSKEIFIFFFFRDMWQRVVVYGGDLAHASRLDKC